MFTLATFDGKPAMHGCLLCAGSWKPFDLATMDPLGFSVESVPSTFHQTVKLAAFGIKVEKVHVGGAFE